MSNVDLVAQFEDLTLLRNQWTHQAHLRVGTWYVSHLGKDKALVELRSRICAYNESVGTENTDSSGYHETITCCYVALIATFLSSYVEVSDIDACADVLIRKWGDRALLLRFYTKERLMSVDARRRWIESDIQPLKFEG